MASVYGRDGRETGILDLVAVNNRLYVHTDGDIVQSTDRGASWEAVRVNNQTVQRSGLSFQFSLIIHS